MQQDNGALLREGAVIFFDQNQYTPFSGRIFLQIRSAGIFLFVNVLQVTST